MSTPDILFGSLFKAVQNGGIFEDSKTFVDAVPNEDPEIVLGRYEDESQESGFDLAAFVDAHFTINKIGDSTFRGDPDRPVREHINTLWTVLQRAADQRVEGSSLIPLPYPYIVPGGRFGEIYYWDSYFTMLGLRASGRTDMIAHMVDNFAHLINTIGHIPNGNRSYFKSRSQPPFFVLMVLLLERAVPGVGAFNKHLEAIESEYAFWMDGELLNKTAHRRVVRLDDDFVLNRYWDDIATPRQESYREDLELSANCDRDPKDLFRNLRAACESGWDFSTRWLTDPKDLGSIATTEIIPVDLNCLMYAIEIGLEECYKHSGQTGKAEMMHERIIRRVSGIENYCWNSARQCYCDYNFIKGEHTPVDSLAMAFPLFMDFAHEKRAVAIARKIETDFLKPGGLITTNEHSGQQWDAPNGWAPLQWIVFEGLKKYGFDSLASECATRWVNNCLRVYYNTGKLVEKYDVLDIELEAGGGEYPVQDGFGWTNGVLLAMMDELGIDDAK